jgi:hypothetical protein
MLKSPVKKVAIFISKWLSMSKGCSRLRGFCLVYKVLLCGQPGTTLVCTVGDPDLVGSGPFCRIRTFLSDPDPEILTGSGSVSPKGAYYKSVKVIFSQQHFQYFSFSQNHEKNFRTFGHNYLKQ